MDKGSKKEKIIVQCVCLLLSMGLWFYVSNVENSIRTLNIDDVPVKLTNIEDLKSVGLALAANQTFHVDLKIEGHSTDIYKVNKEMFQLEANLGDYALKKGENRIPVRLIDYPSSINVKNTNSLNIRIILDEYKEKIVPVESQIKITTISGYFAESPQLSSNEIIVSGPAAQVEKVNKVVARGTIENINSDIVKNYNLIAVDNDGNEIKNLTLSESTVTITIPVSKGKIVPIKVMTKGSLPSGRLLSIKSTIKEIEINGPEELTKNISEITTSAIDLSTITESRSIDVELITPEGISIDNNKKVISVKVEVEKSSSKEVSVRFKTESKSQEFNYSFSTEEVKIKVYDYEEKLANITPDTFNVEIDLNGLNEGEHEVVPKVTINGDMNLHYEIVTKIKVTITKIEQN